MVHSSRHSYDFLPNVSACYNDPSMDTEYESSRIERLKRGLYSPTGAGLSSDRSVELTPADIDVANNWNDTEIISSREKIPHKPISILLLKIFVTLAIVAMIGSGGYLLYQYFDPFNKPSDKNIQIAFDVPVAVTPGVPVDITIRVANQNRIALEYANLTIAYPSGTRAGDNADKDVHEEKSVLGTIGPGEVVEYHAKEIFLGEENTNKEIHATLEYRFHGINSVFTKDESRPVQMLASPINLTVDTLKEVNAGQPLELSINALSNTVIPLRDVFVTIDYPVSFTFQDAEPKPTFGNNVWRVGTLDPAGKFALTVRGVLSGEDTEEKVFHTSVGVGSDQTERSIDTVYGKMLSTVTLKRPFIGIGLSINGKPAGDAVGQFGQRIDGIVNWVNNLPTRILDAQIEVRLRGVALDRSSISAGSGGFYRSSDDTIFWDERGDPTLSLLEAGQAGMVNFAFLPLPSVTGNQLLTNPTIAAEVTVRGKRISESGVPEEIKTVMTQNVRISSQAQFAARAVYYVGPFVNTGPIPPRVEQETTYTIIWSIMNTSNAITGAEVRGVLPPYIRWAGSVSPVKENISYNPQTNEVVWSPGDVPSGTGVTKPPREVAFQIVFTPSLSQVKRSANLLTNIRFTATDSFTNAQFKDMKSDISSNLSTDPKASDSSGTVVP